MYREIVIISTMFFFFGTTLVSGQLKFSGNINFESNANLEVIKASSQKLSGVLDFSSSSFAFTVKVSTFEGFNSALQKEHFHENYLESKHYPVITYTGKMIDKVPTIDGTYTIRTKGFFDIHGVKRERIIKNIVTLSKGVYTINSTFNINLAEYNITIPKIVNKKIAEHIDVVIEAKSLNN